MTFQLSNDVFEWLATFLSKLVIEILIVLLFIQIDGLVKVFELLVHLRCLMLLERAWKVENLSFFVIIFDGPSTMGF